MSGDQPVDGREQLGSAPTEAAPVGAGVESRLQMANISQGLFDDDAAPVRIGRFVVIERIGSGGMGTVLRAYDPDLDRGVALKVIKRETLSRDPNAHERMAQEAKSLAKLNHPNVVAVHEVGETNGQMFVAMELVEGQDLAAWRSSDDHRRPFDATLDRLIQAGRGLAAAHDAGVVHRDFKPANVLIGRDGRVRVADFGLARPDSVTSDPAGQPKTDPASGGDSDSGSGSLTKTGAVVGTPAYMAPEQRLGEPASTASDQYAFCVSTWEALFGDRPRGTKAAETPVPNGIGARGRWVARVLRRGLAAEPRDRYPSLAALLTDLEHNPARRRRQWMLAGGAALVVAAGYGGFRAEEASRCADASKPARDLWDDARKQQLSAAFDSVKWSMAADSWSRFQANVDGYVEAWVEHTDASCQAAKVDGTLDAAAYADRTRCLDDRLVRLEALLDAFSDPDRDLVVSAPVNSSALPPLQPCIDRPRSVAPSAGAPEALTGQLARGLGTLDAGRYAEARKTLEAVVADAEQAGATTLEAKARVGLALTLLRTAGPKPAAQMFEAAYWAALEQGDDAAAASAARGMVDTLAPTAELDEAERWGQYARVLGTRAGVGKDAESTIESSLGQIAFERGDIDAAETHMRNAAEFAVEAWGPEHPSIVSSQQNLALILRMRGKFDEAIELARRGHAIRVEHFGAHHPSVGHSTTNLAQALGRQGKHTEAIAQFNAAIEIFSGAYGRQHVLVGQTLTNLGVSQDQIGDDPAAQASHQEALEIFEALVEPNDTRILTAKMNLAGTQATNGHCDAAAELLEVVVTELAKRSPKNPRLGVARTIFGACLIRLERYDQALAQLRQAAEILAARPGDEASVIAYIALALEEQGDLDAAFAEATKAVEMLRPATHDRTTFADALHRLASIERRRGNLDTAVEHSAQSLAVSREVLGQRPGLVRVLADRAEILVAANRHQEAESVAREGIALIERHGLASTLAAPMGAQIYLALAEATAARDPAASNQAAAEAGKWLARTDETYDEMRARARALQQSG